ncbi:hypothetical protein GQ54DRAFT_295784 [Martensiomyces pterosporus]|nr:hypothetical protein GQ54DRAFT_295784 [Martensiomyces pterosporus]
MVSSASISLLPDSPEVILYGGPSEAAGSFITGRVVISAKYASQVKSLTVTLRPQKRRLFQSMHCITPHTDLRAQLVEDSKTAHQILHTINGNSSHEWRFSIPVPGSMAETVYTRDNYIAYELIAEARTPSTFSSLLQSRTSAIAIKRAPSIDSQWATMVSEGVEESAAWRERLELTLVTQSRVVSDRQSMSVRGIIRPLEKGISLLRAGFQIVEKVINDVDIFGMPHALTTSNIIAGTSIDMPQCQAARGEYRTAGEELDGLADLFGGDNRASASGLPIQHEISASRCLSVPEAYTGIQYDIRRGQIRIGHDLIFFVSITDELGAVHNLRLATPVFVLPRFSLKCVDLPRYEDAGMDELIESSVKTSPLEHADSDPTLRHASLAGAANSSTMSLASDGSAPDAECPLALQGYRSCGDIPPPTYSCIAAGGELDLSDSSIAVPQQAITTNRLSGFYSRALHFTPPATGAPALS